MILGRPELGNFTLLNLLEFLAGKPQTS